MNAGLPSLIVVGHGSSTSPAAEDALAEHLVTLRHTGRFETVQSHFVLKGNNIPSLPEGEVFLVPFFMSDGFFVQKKIPEQFGLTNGRKEEESRIIYQCDAIGVNPELSDILAQMGEEICEREDVPPSDAAILLAAHGSSKSSASREATIAQQRHLQKRAQFKSVECAYLEEAPVIEEMLQKCASDTKLVIVLGLFSAAGPHACEDVPAAIEKFEAEHGKTGQIHYAGPVGVRQEIVKLILDSVSRRASEVGYKFPDD